MMKSKLLLVGAFAVVMATGAGGSAVFLMPPLVETQSPERGKAVEAIYATGTVEPTVMIPLAPKTTSRLTGVLVDEGAQVKKGDVLATFEDNDLNAVIDQISAQVDLAKKELERKEKLYQRKFIAADAYDNAVSNLAVTEAALREAEAKRTYTTITAPEDAMVIKRDGEVGEILTTNDPVFYLSCCAPNRISAEVDEEDIVRVRIGQKVLIQSDAYPDKTFEGKITAITPKGDPESRSFRVRISVPEDFPFLVGMTAETNIVTNESDNALLIPVTSLGKKNMVQIVRENKVHLVSVKTGAEGENKVEILEGLTETDKILSVYKDTLEDGHKVRVKEAE